MAQRKGKDVLAMEQMILDQARALQQQPVAPAVRYWAYEDELSPPGFERRVIRQSPGTQPFRVVLYGKEKLSLPVPILSPAQVAEHLCVPVSALSEDEKRPDPVRDLFIVENNKVLETVRSLLYRIAPHDVEGQLLSIYRSDDERSVNLRAAVRKTLHNQLEIPGGVILEVLDRALEWRFRNRQ